jgi:Ca-activated chloride channel family protein
VEAIRALDVASQQEGAATALGDAIALGVERMQAIEEQRSGLSAEAEDVTRIMIILTDGESNAGEIDPITAARMAATFGIRLYTIGVGSQRGMAPVRVTDPFTGRKFLEYRPVSLDEETLRMIAEIGEGRYFRATDPDSLRQVYATIDRLERTELEERRLIDYGEMAIEPVMIGGFRAPPLVVLALALLVLESVLSLTRWRVLP